MRRKTITTIIGLFAVGAILTTLPAKATLTIDLTVGNTAISGYPGPFGTVTVTRVDNNNATVTLTALNQGAYKYSFGDGTTLGLNLAGGGSFSVSGMTGNTLAQGAVQSLPSGNQPQVSSGNVSGFGTFNFALDSFDGFNYSVTSLSFNLHTTSGAWTSESAILTPNSKNNSVAGHAFIRNLDGSDTGVTGFVSTPEPSTVIAGALLLLPFGASAIRVLRRNRAA